jgi:glucosamine 6-phosphate synthetase-like amidotransferase/phosphosugar isomerase protein
LNSIPKENAHPNFDHADRIALFHNGNIANYSDLKASLTVMGIKIPESQDMDDLTDS